MASHQLAQLFPKNLLILQSMRKWDLVSLSLQNEQVLHILIFGLGYIDTSYNQTLISGCLVVGFFITFLPHIIGLQCVHTFHWWCHENTQKLLKIDRAHNQFLVPQIEYPLGGSSKKGSHVYFLLQVFWVILLFYQIVLLSDINVVLMWQ